MNLYEYKAVNRAGLTVCGVINALDSESVVNQLQRINLQLVSIPRRRKHDVTGSRLLPLASTYRLAENLILYLAKLMRSGLPLDTAFAEIAKTDDTRLAALAIVLLERVKSGEKLAQTLQSLELLPTSACRAIAVSEKSGNLASGLAGVADRLQSQRQFKRRIKQACLYPIVLLFVLGSLMSYLIVAVVPQLLQFSIGLGQDIPSTAHLLQQIVHYSVLIILPTLGSMVLFLLVVARVFRSNHSVRLFVDRCRLRLPLFGRFSLLAWRARFFSELQCLTEAGIDLLEALELSLDGSSNQFIRINLRVLRLEIEDGKRLSEAMRCTALFNSESMQRISLGELTGDYTDAFHAQAESCRQDVQLWLHRLEKRVGPVLLSVCGLLILWIIVAVIAPVYSAAIGAGALL